MNTSSRDSDCPRSPAEGSEERRAERPAAPQEASAGEAGNAVTPGLPFSVPTKWEFLAANVDTMDLSLYVDWGTTWSELFTEFAVAKERAQNTKGVLFRDRDTLVLPSGGKKGFQWHLQRPDIHLFLKSVRVPDSQTPNVSVSLSAFSLWQYGPLKAFSHAEKWIRDLGGEVTKLKLSRIDLAADFQVEGGLSSAFLKTHCVCKSQKRRFFEEGDSTQTSYFGDSDSPLQLRIYDKAAELKISPLKNWIQDIWERESAEGVFRVEFQLRREVLRQFQLNDIPDLSKLGGLWQHLTRKWFSLRIPDNPNSARRQFHPFWALVQSVAKKFGRPVPMKRHRKRPTPNVDKILSQIRGHMVSYAAMMGREVTLEECAALFVMTAKTHRLEKGFEDDICQRRIRFGVHRAGGDPVPVKEIPNV